MCVNIYISVNCATCIVRKLEIKHVVINVCYLFHTMDSETLILCVFNTLNKLAEYTVKSIKHRHYIFTIVMLTAFNFSTEIHLQQFKIHEFCKYLQLAK